MRLSLLVEVVDKHHRNIVFCRHRYERLHSFIVLVIHIPLPASAWSDTFERIYYHNPTFWVLGKPSVQVLDAATVCRSPLGGVVQGGEVDVWAGEFPNPLM